MSKKSNESNKRSNNGRGFSWESFSSKVNVFSKKNRSQDRNQEDERENEPHNGSSSSWSSIHVPYAQVSGPQSANLPPPHIIQQQQQQQWTPKSQSNSQSNLSVSPSLLVESDVPERSSVDLSPTWNASSSLSSLPQNNNNNHPADGIDNDNSSTPLQPTSSFNKSYRLNEFTIELKYLFKDLIEYGKAKTWKKKLLTVILFICSMVVFYDLIFGKQNYIVTWLHLFIVWMTKHYILSVFAFVGIFVLSTRKSRKT
ncbi:MAG: hypothetical protein ACI90V_007172 [Bacillariaceae sp.]|jgi:hypothetical protein